MESSSVTIRHSALITQYLPGYQFEEWGDTLSVPVSAEHLRDAVTALMQKLSFLTMVATDERATGQKKFCIRYIFGVPGENVFITLVLPITDTSFPSMAPFFPVCTLYEREIQTMFGLTPIGHPDPRSLVLHEENWPAYVYPLRKDFAWNTALPMQESSTYAFKKIEGEGLYEIPVGPVHAGIIEPGHFRFSVAGEEIVALEARLGWVHKGVEKLFETLPLEQKVSLAERISGDSSFSHSLAFTEAVEKLAGITVSKKAEYIRLICAELERLTMHTYDIGNIAGNGTGFSVVGAHGFRLTETLRQLAETLTGSRFLRGINVIGGVTVDLNSEKIEKLHHFLHTFKKDFASLMDILEHSATFANRVEGTGTLTAETVTALGGVGIAARSVGIPKDARVEYPYGGYREISPIVQTTEGGDVAARFTLRHKEVYESIDLILRALQTLPTEGILRPTTAPVLPTEGIGVGVVEGWRGEIVYVVLVQSGEITRVKVRGPSFLHWPLFSHLSSTDMVPDFPLINKSFNLSYTGNDL